MRAAAVVLCVGLGACLTSVGCDAQRAPPAPVPQQRVVYDGATSISRKVLPLALPVFEQRSGVHVDVERSGGGKGLKAMLAGQADVAGLARALSPEERSQRPFVAIIGYDGLGAWVNGANPVRGLTLAQLREIFAGRITNWKALGGKDLPVLVCTERLLSERTTLLAIRQLVMEGSAFGPVRELEDPADCLALVAREPGGLTPATVAYAIPGVRALAIDGLFPTAQAIRDSTYPLTRPLLLVTREVPTGAVKEFVDFMVSSEGQALVAQGGFIPAR